MFRARLASVVVAASLAAGGCSCFDHPWFCPREKCCPTPCTPCCNTAGSVPIIDGPILPSPEPVPVLTGQMPVASQPRLVPAPQSMPMPYTP